jgi:NOL1/NOP2/fmu family ribosome biogenesis protein
MFRRDFESAKSWAANKPEACSMLQKEILHHAAAMLKPGGRLVYSTCTFSETEDEDVIAEFLRMHTDFSLQPVDWEGLGISQAQVLCKCENNRTLRQISSDICAAGHGPNYELTGVDALCDSCSTDVSQMNNHYAARIWPHKAEGEGHFAALLEKAGRPDIRGNDGKLSYEPNEQFQSYCSSPDDTPRFPSKRVLKEDKSRRSRGGYAALNNVCSPPEVFCDFCREQLTPEAAAFLLDGGFTVNGVSLYRVSSGLPDLRGLRLARSGWYMGDITSGRFTPSQALGMGLKLGNANVAVDLQENEAVRYLRGESITPTGEVFASLTDCAGKPWVLVGCMGYPLGWARWVNGRLKNHLPAGWIGA